VIVGENGKCSHTSVYRAFVHTASEHGSRPFIEIVPDAARHYGIEPVALSYEHARRRIDALAENYRVAGVGNAHRVTMLLENRPDFFLHWLALNAVGASVVPLNPDWRPAELDYVLGDSGACLAVVIESRRTELQRAAERVNPEIKVIASEETAQLDRSKFAKQDTGAQSNERTECALLYTSGTTGAPKGCILPNAYFLRGGERYANLGGLCRVEVGRDRLITPLPMYHMNAMACSTMAMLLTGGCVIPLDRFHPNSWWRSVRESRATIIHYLGVMPAMILSQESSPEDRDHSVRFGFGAGISSSDHGKFEQRFGFPLIEAWAMTETGMASAIVANYEPRKIGTACFGAPPDRLEWRIVTAEGRDAAVNQPGELLVRSAGPEPRSGFFAGYLKNDAATAEAWRDGYFHTGDIIFRDEDGLFHFVDRKKNVIRRSGENIAAVEVEGVLKQHPGVAAIAVAPVPDALRGDEVMACVVRHDSARFLNEVALARSIVDFCLQRLAYYKAPGYVGFCEQLPLTATEKIQRSELHELARRLHASGQYVDTRSMKRRNA
jgi:acyl-CoA synthetase (AMP-forming)/AMP-acid ligase II